MSFFGKLKAKLFRSSSKLDTDISNLVTDDNNQEREDKGFEEINQSNDVLQVNEKDNIISGHNSSEKKEKVMSKISDSNHLKDIKELLTYSEDTAGAIMAKELVKVKESLSVLKCIDYMRAQAENVTRVHSIYVVDNNDKLLMFFNLIEDLFEDIDKKWLL